MSRKYKYTARCTYCERQFPTRLRPPEGQLSCGVGECTRKHNDAVAAWHEQASKTRRQPRQTRVVMSEWGMAAMLSRPRNTKPSTDD